ncbi:helix-turn-helix transcriptional regulator [Agromyces neolithicus]|uniref:Helix-turn-helix domain-containing protein n=1 Tax=Agromyces neolithicus TaxID=269420 RepID=A0ABP4YF36_9MICO
MAADETRNSDDLITVTVLSDPTRRRVYTAVSRAAGPVSRDQVATMLGLPRSTAAFHLERLADVGLLTVEFRRLSGRTGPGSGRPAKVYVRPDSELSVSVPPRLYEVAGEIMAEAIARAVGDDVPVRDALRDAALRTGQRLAGTSADLDDALEQAGLEPMADGDDTVLGTCPFHRLARQNPAVVCELNHAMLCGMAEAVGDDPRRVHLDAGSGACCIRVTATP